MGLHDKFQYFPEEALLLIPEFLDRFQAAVTEFNATYHTSLPVPAKIEDQNGEPAQDEWEFYLSPYQMGRLSVKDEDNEELLTLSFGFLLDEYPMGLYGSANLYWMLEDLEDAQRKRPFSDRWTDMLEKIKLNDWLMEVEFDEERQELMPLAGLALRPLKDSGGVVLLESDHPDVFPMEIETFSKQFSPSNDGELGAFLRETLL